MPQPDGRLSRLAASPCSNPEMSLEEALVAYGGLGFRKFEVFTSWAGSAFDIDADPGDYLAAGRRHGMEFVSMHLPPVKGDDTAATLDRAVRAAEFAEAIGAKVVLYKADSRETYVAAAAEFLDRTDGIAVTPVVQNHFGTPVSSLDDFREVLGGIDDERMKALLEVGHFHSAGVEWPEGYELLRGRMALVHVKDQVGRRSVPFGTGEIDLPGLFSQLAADGYAGDVVVEMETEDRENRVRYLGEALEYLRGLMP